MLVCKPATPMTIGCYIRPPFSVVSKAMSKMITTVVKRIARVTIYDRLSS